MCESRICQMYAQYYLESYFNIEFIHFLQPVFMQWWDDYIPKGDKVSVLFL